MVSSTATTTTTTTTTTATSKKKQNPEAAEEIRLRDLLRSKMRKRVDPDVKRENGGSSVTSSSNSSTPNTVATNNNNPGGTNNQPPPLSQQPNVQVDSGGNHSGHKHSPTSMHSRGSSSPQDNSSHHEGETRDRKHKRQRRSIDRDLRHRHEGSPLPPPPPPPYGRRGGYGYRREGRWRGPPPPPPPPHYRGGPDGPGRWERGGYPPPSRDRYMRGGLPPPPFDRRGGPPPPRDGYEFDYEYDSSKYHSRSRSRSPRGYRGDRLRRSPSRSGSSGSSRRSLSSRSYSRSPSRSYSRSRSRSGSVSSRSSRGRSRNASASRSPASSRGRRRSRRSASRSRSRSRSDYSVSSSVSSSSSSSSSDEEPLEENLTRNGNTVFSKDQRTVFVSQLVMRATEKEIRRHFRRTVGCRVREVILLRDKRTGNHKGCAYVELGSIEDVNKAVNASGQPPDFQRFPLLVKPSESEKNYVSQGASSVLTATMMGKPATAKPILSEDGKMIEAQKVYVGGLDPVISEEHIFALFSHFGQLEKVTMQVDPTTSSSRGYAFLSFRDPKEAFLAIQTMNNQMLAGRSIKTGWASHVSPSSGVKVVTASSFPNDAADRARKAITVLAQMSNLTPSSSTPATVETTLTATKSAKSGASAIPTVAEARASLVAQHAASSTVAAAAAAASASISTPPQMIGGLDKPTTHLLVHNMFDKDEETGDAWPKEIKEDFEDECSKFGKIIEITVMFQEPGGKIYATFETIDAALKCAKNLAGRWFDKRQLRVDFVEASSLPK